MSEYCTCGAQLPPDARFCHKCGKPQYEMPVEEEEVEPLPVAAPPPLPETPQEISFKNGTAVRIGLGAASMTWVLGMFLVQLSPVFLLIVPTIAGFLAALYYGQQTKQRLTTGAGARMGWITGLCWFSISIVFFTMALLTIDGQGGWDAFRQQMLSQGRTASEIDEVLRLLQTPAGMGTLVVLVFIMSFLISTILPTLGGALGAKFQSRE